MDTFTMTDADIAQAAAEREIAVRRMFAEVELDAYIIEQAEAQDGDYDEEEAA